MYLLYKTRANTSPRFPADFQRKDSRQGVQRRRQLYAEGARHGEPPSCHLLVQERGTVVRGRTCPNHRLHGGRALLPQRAAYQAERLRRVQVCGEEQVWCGHLPG